MEGYMISAKTGEIVGTLPSEPTPEELLADWRETAWMVPENFFILAKRLQILTPEEALEAAKGNAPQSFIDAISAKPDIDQVEAQILFARMRAVERNHPYVLAIIDAEIVTAAVLDEAFGWDG